jgi:hypothetical protein
MPSTKTTSKTAWQRRNDRGPHLATLPSGAVVKFVVADLSMLLRSGKLPEPLQLTATLMGAHEAGPSGYMNDLVGTAIARGGDGQETVASAITIAKDLTHHLIAESLVEPAVTPEEVAEGLFPEADILMLTELATRERNVDAAGKRLPIIGPYEEKWATFRYERSGAERSDAGGANGTPIPGAVPDADGGDV